MWIRKKRMVAGLNHAYDMVIPNLLSYDNQDILYLNNFICVLSVRIYHYINVYEKGLTVWLNGPLTREIFLVIWRGSISQTINFMIWVS